MVSQFISSALSDKELERYVEEIRSLKTMITQVIRGKDQQVELALMGALTGGHLLIEDVPGVGKTTLARTLAIALGGEFQRVQCTADLLPSDLTGVNIYHPGEGQFNFQPGPLFSHLLLADELNRATPKAQSSLLEAMEERQVTIDRITYPLPDPFWVIATQNPQSFAGTFLLPESQLDRFALSLTLGYLQAEEEKNVLLSASMFDEGIERGWRGRDLLSSEDLSARKELWRELRQATHRVVIDPDLAAYAVDVANATRNDTELRLGVSTRGALSWLRLAQAKALIHGRSFVSPDDLRSIANAALAHRIWPQGTRATREERRHHLEAIMTRIPLPR